MNESLCTRCPIGILRERRASMMSPMAQMRPHAIAVLWFRTNDNVPCVDPHLSELIPFLIILVLGIVAHDVIFIIIIPSIFINRVSSHFLCSISCHSFEALSTDTTMQSKSFQAPTFLASSDHKAEREKSDENTSRNNIENANLDSNMNSNPDASITVNCKSVNGIVSSPDNPATVLRLSQRGSTNVSWHKRVVVHRVPRTDASRSMFVSGNQSKEGLSSQCCVIV